MDHEPQWDSLVGSQNSIKALLDDNDDLTSVSMNQTHSSLTGMAPMSSISEVTLDNF